MRQRQAIRKRVIYQERRHRQKPRIVHGSQSVALKGAEIVRITQFVAQLFEYCPIPIPAFRTRFTLKMFSEIVLYTVVVDQRIIHVEEKYDVL